jgi:uncharacterized membrane protein YgcG
MPLVAIFVGAVMLDLAARGTEHEFARQLGADFGQGSKFWAWAAAIVILGALGYAPGLKKIGWLPLTLVVLVMILANGGFYARFASLVANPPKAAPAVPLSQYGSSGSSSSSGSGSSSSSSSSSGSELSTLASVASIAAIAA